MMCCSFCKLPLRAGLVHLQSAMDCAERCRRPLSSSFCPAKIRIRHVALPCKSINLCQLGLMITTSTQAASNMLGGVLSVGHLYSLQHHQHQTLDRMAPCLYTCTYAAKDASVAKAVTPPRPQSTSSDGQLYQECDMQPAIRPSWNTVFNLLMYRGWTNSAGGTTESCLEAVLAPSLISCLSPSS